MRVGFNATASEIRKQYAGLILSNPLDAQSGNKYAFGDVISGVGDYSRILNHREQQNFFALMNLVVNAPGCELPAARDAAVKVGSAVFNERIFQDFVSIAQIRAMLAKLRTVDAALKDEVIANYQRFMEVEAYYNVTDKQSDVVRGYDVNFGVLNAIGALVGDGRTKYRIDSMVRDSLNFSRAIAPRRIYAHGPIVFGHPPAFQVSDPAVEEAARDHFLLAHPEEHAKERDKLKTAAFLVRQGFIPQSFEAELCPRARVNFSKHLQN